MYIFVTDIDFVSVSMIFRLFFRTFSTRCYFLFYILNVHIN